MQWVREDVKEIFGDPANPSALEIHDDDAPQFVVAHGIAKYFYAQQKALHLLISKISSIDFAALYRQADEAATVRATEDFSQAVVDAIRDIPGCTAATMRERFIEMMRSMNPNNAAYVRLFTDEFFRSLTTHVRDAVRESVKETFGVDLPLDEFSLPRFTLPITRWDDDSLSPGGGIYEKISSALIASKSSFAFIFKWDTPCRRRTRRNGTLRAHTPHLRHAHHRLLLRLRYRRPRRQPNGRNKAHRRRPLLPPPALPHHLLTNYK